METKIKVLLVDASEDFCTLLRRTLEEEGDIVVTGTATDGVQALSLLHETQPDVLLLDLILPKLDGLGVLQRLSETDCAPATIVMSAFYSEQMVTKSAALGAYYFIPKPCDMQALAGAIRQSVAIPEVHPPVFAAVTPEEADLESAVTEIIHEIGVPAHIKGYQYLHEAIMITIQDMDVINAVTKVLYPAVAKKIWHHAKPRGARHPPCHRGRVGPRGHRNAAKIFWLHGQQYQGQADKQRIYRHDRGLPVPAPQVAGAVTDRVSPLWRRPAFTARQRQGCCPQRLRPVPQGTHFCPRGKIARPPIIMDFAVNMTAAGGYPAAAYCAGSVRCVLRRRWCAVGLLLVARHPLPDSLQNICAYCLPCVSGR